MEFYELRQAPGTLEVADAHAPGTTENLLVASGTLELTIADETYRLGGGDSILFEADVPHSYSNVARDEATYYLVMSYAQEVG